MSEYFFLQAFENMLISAYMYFLIVFIVSVTNNASIQYITWGLISSLLYINFIHLPFAPLYIRWVCCCNVQTFVTYNWNKICICIDHSVTGIVRVCLWIQHFSFSAQQSHCNGTDTFVKVSGYSPGREYLLPLYASQGHAITRECYRR